MTKQRISTTSKSARLVLALVMFIGAAVLMDWRSNSVEAAVDGLIPVVPARVLDTRSGKAHHTIDGQYEGLGRLNAGRELEFDVTGRAGVPVDAIGVMLNLTVVWPSSSGYLTVYPCGDPRPQTSNLNFSARRTTSNAVLAMPGDDGSVCIYSTARTGVVADVQGYVAHDSSMVPLPSVRLLDTRVRGSEAASGSTIELQVGDRGGVAADAEAVALNLIAVDPAATGHLIVFACDDERPLASSLNYNTNQTRSTLVFTKTDDRGRVCIYTSAEAHIVADVQAQVVSRSSMIATTIARLLDTRAGHPTVDGLHDDSRTVRARKTVVLEVNGRADVPADATAVLLNVAAVNPSRTGYLTVYPCGIERPLTSNVNYSPGTTSSNLVFAMTGEGEKVCIYTSARTNIVADVQGHFTPETAPVPEALQASAIAPPTTTLPVITVPATTLPVITVPATTTPATTLPVITVPATTTPATTVPATTLPVITVPATTTPPTTTPATTPPTTAPATTTPPPPPNGSGFVHPGVLVDQAQLDEIRSHVAAGQQPWAGVVDRMYGSSSSTPTASRPTAYRFSSLSYVPAPVRVIQASSAGTQSYLDSHGLTEIGDVEHIDDARAAYTHALLWHATGNRAHADKAIEIMNAWSSTLTEIKFDQPRRVDNGGIIWVDGKLHAGWGASLFARAGELIRYSNTGWSNHNIARFEDMLRDVYLPLTIDGWSNGANWMMTLAEGTISIGVFTNDRATFDAGVAMWRTKAPTTIYHPSDGTLPLSPVSWMDTANEINNYWRNPDQYVTGLQGETLRDLAHMMMGLGAMANAAETAYLQGVDLYGEQADRIIAGYELNAGYINAYLDETARLGRKPSSTWTPPNWPGNSGSFKIINKYHTAGWNVAHHHYTTRTNTAMPNTSRLVQRISPNTAQPAHHMAWEPLTHST